MSHHTSSYATAYQNVKPQLVLSQQLNSHRLDLSLNLGVTKTRPQRPTTTTCIPRLSGERFVEMGVFFDLCVIRITMALRTLGRCCSRRRRWYMYTFFFSAHFPHLHLIFHKAYNRNMSQSCDMQREVKTYPESEPDSEIATVTDSPVSTFRRALPRLPFPSLLPTSLQVSPRRRRGENKSCAKLGCLDAPPHPTSSTKKIHPQQKR
jgi:hypothetical protein